MKNLKILFCLFFLLSIGSTNVWGEVTASYSGTTLTISGTGEMTASLATTYISWNTTWKPSATAIVISDGVTAIHNEAFKGFTKVTSVTIANSVQSIGEQAFSGCSKLTSIVIPDGITTIENRTFYNCSALVSVTIPASVTTIDYGAFYGCSSVSEIHASTPNQWAGIVFNEGGGASIEKAHPFGVSSAKSRNFYFYGNSSPSNAIVLEPGITEVKPYAFYKATDITGINIPGSVTTIGTNAFNVSSYSSAWVAINKKTAPTTVGASAFKTGVTLYVPTGSTGYGSTWNGLTVNNANVSGKIQEGDNKVSWDLSENGVLTLDATNSTTKNLSINNAGASLPWAQFRRLVYKIKIKGEIEGIGNLLKYIYGNSEIILDQDAIPTINANGIATTGSTSYAELFNKRDQLKLTIKLASLTHSTTSNLASAPLSDIKSGTTKWWQVGLSEQVNIEDNNDNSETLLSNCSTYVEKPFDLQLNRTLSTEYYNTFCSPVNMTEAEVTAMFGAETELVEFDGTEIINDTLRLKFKTAESITAGKPYLIWPESPVSNPTFTDVNPASIATSGSIVSGTHADFHGTLAPVDASDYAEDKNFIFLLADNKLTYATGGTLKGMRAYFLLKEGTPASVMAKRPVLQIGNGENTTTDLGQVPSDKIQCTKVLRDGQIYILRGEKAYNLQGIEIDRPNKL